MQWSTCPISQRFWPRPRACWQPAACWHSPRKPTAARASSSATGCATRTARPMCGRRLQPLVLNCRCWRICPPGTRTTSRRPVWSWWRRRRDFRLTEMLSASQAVLCRETPSSLLPCLRECRSLPATQGETTMKIKQTRREFGATALATIAASVLPAPYVWAAEKKYDSGASDTEIKLGQTVPHSGPGSIYGVLGRVGEAYFQMLNENGGINGRQIKFFTMADAYSPPKCGEATRRPVDQEYVLALVRRL